MKNTKLFKRIAVIVAGLMLLGTLAGCQKSEAAPSSVAKSESALPVSESAAQSAEQSNTQAEEAPPENEKSINDESFDMVGDIDSINGKDISISSFEVKQSGEGFVVEEGEKKTLSYDDNTVFKKIVMPEGATEPVLEDATASDLKEGSNIKAWTDEKDGKNIANTIQINDIGGKNSN